MKFFDIVFPDTAYRMKVLNLFPEEFRKGYMAYKHNKLKAESLFDKEIFTTEIKYDFNGIDRFVIGRKKLK